MADDGIALASVTACVCVDCGHAIFSVPEKVDVAKCYDCARAAVGADWTIGAPLGTWHLTLDPFLKRKWANPDAEMAVFGPLETKKRPKLSHFALSDPNVVLRCIRCREEWPQVLGLHPVGRVQAFAGHDRVVHDEGVWLVGGPGGADEMVCAPCGGGDREKRPLEGGPDHAKCLKGKGRGWAARCGCSHRSRDELDQIAGKTGESGRKWRPARWSDPEIVEIASENVQNRWNQLNLWGDEPA